MVPHRLAAAPRPFSLLIVLLLALVLAPTAGAQEGWEVGKLITVELRNGDVLSGRLLEVSGNRIVLDHDVLGRITISRLDLAPLEPTEDEIEELEPEWPVWSGAFTTSIAGAEGNTDSQGWRLQMRAQREGEEHIDSLDFTGVRKEEDNETTDENYAALYRHEWKIKDSRYLPFVQATWTRDLFKDYGYRLSSTAGVGYKCLLGPVHILTGRAGLGASKKYDAEPGVDDDLTPEGLVGFDYRWNINETTAFTFNTSIFPNLDDGGEYRANSGAAIETRVDPSSAWLIKLGADHQYDTLPGPDDRRWDYQYYAGLQRNF